jgi:hypothetical protein
LPSGGFAAIKPVGRKAFSETAEPSSLAISFLHAENIG